MSVRTQIVVILVALGLVLGSVSPTYAWKSKKADAWANQIKPLSSGHRKKIVSQITTKLIDHAFFAKNEELAHRVCIARLEVLSPEVGMTDVEFTDLVTNALIVKDYIMITNIEITLDMQKNDFKLMHYGDPLETRKKGILAGADYYIMGSVRAYMEQIDEKKQQQVYKAELQVHNIRTNDLVFTTTYEYKRKGKNKSKFRKDR